MRLLVVIAGLFLALAGAAAAQERAWVQIESQPTLREAEDRARAYATLFPDVVGFRVASGWYAIALGPYTPAAAEERLRLLRADNLVPADSFVALGEVYRGPFWPVGADPLSLPPQASVTPDAEALAPVPDPAPAAPATGTETAAAEPVPPPQADETLAEAKAAEAALSRDERKAVQEVLGWFGFYSSAIDGAFGQGTRAAMQAWQEAKGYEPTGVMTTRQRQEIFAERAAIEAELGLTTVTEEEAGIEIAMPLALVAFDRYEPPFVHYAAKDGSGVRVVLISQPGDAAALAGLYDMLQTLDVVPPGGPRDRSDRSFRIEAADARVASFAQAELRDDTIKGFLLVWPPEKGALAGRALTAMKASFKPVAGRVLDPGLVPLDEGARAGMLAGLEVRRPDRSRSGFYVSGKGEVLTTAEAVEGCGRITLDDATEASVSFADPALGIALLAPAVALSPPGVAALAAGPARPGAQVAVAGYPYEDAIPAPVLTFGLLAAETGLDGEPGLRRLDLSVRPGDAGGPVVDAAGGVLGLLLPRATGGSRVLPEGVEFAASASAIAEKLAAAGVVPATAEGAAPLSPDALADRASAMTVRVGCWP